MRQIIIFITALFLFLGIKAYGQVKPAQAQYFQEKSAFINPGFEQGYKGWEITGCSKSLIQVIPFMGRSLRMICAGETFSIKQESTKLVGAGLQAFAGCKIWPTASGVNYRTLANGAQINTYAVPAGGFNKYEEDFTIDATSNGVEIYGTTYTGEITIEDCFIGLTPDGYLADPLPDQTGNAGKFLTTDGSVTSWADPIGVTLSNKGEIQGHDGVNPVAIPAPTQDGQILIADSSLAAGVGYKNSIVNISQAHYVGSIRWVPTTNCLWTRSSSSYGNFTADADCDDNARLFEGSGIGDPTAGQQPQFSINTVRTNGFYKIAVQGGFYKAGSGANGCRFRLASNEGNTTIQSIGDGSGYARDSFMQWEVKFNTSENKTITIDAASEDGVSNCHIDARLQNLKVAVYFYPDSSSVAAAENFELSAASANELTMRLDGSGTVLSENYDWINGNCTKPTSQSYNCVFNSGVFTEQPSCVATSVGTANRTANISYSGSNSILITMYTADTAGSTGIPPTVHCSKQGADVDKERVLVGSFQNINSTNLCSVEAKTNDAETITGNTEDIPFKTESVDNCNAWGNGGNTGSNTNDQFIAPRDGRYMFLVQSFTTTISSLVMPIYKNGSLLESSGEKVGDGSNERRSAVYILDLLKNDAITFRFSASATLQTSSVSHWIKIQEMPDYEAIVKNLYNEKTECQRKFLTADVTSDGAISDLQFNNLEIGKKYETCTRTRVACPSAVDNVDLNTDHNGSRIIQNTNGCSTASGIVQKRYICVKFTASSTTLTNTASSISAGNRIEGNGTLDETYATLCELPDSTIINSNKWD